MVSELPVWLPPLTRGVPVAFPRGVLQSGSNPENVLTLPSRSRKNAFQAAAWSRFMAGSEYVAFHREPPSSTRCTVFVSGLSNRWVLVSRKNRAVVKFG